LDLERREVALAVRPLPRGCRGRDEEIERRDAEQGWTPRPERDRPVQAVVLTGRAEARQSPAASHKGRRLRYLQVRSAWRDESRRGSLCRNPQPTEPRGRSGTDRAGGFGISRFVECARPLG